MPVYLYALATAFVAAFFLTPLVRRVALRIGAVDKPGIRSVHTEATPQLGGVAVFIAFSLTILFFLGKVTPVPGLLLGGVVILIVGLVDDFCDLRPIWKFSGQLLAAGILVASGVRIEWVTNPFGGLWVLDSIGLPLSIPITLLWIIAFVNMLNLIDGLDGLAAGISAIAALTLLFSALQTGQSSLAVLMAAAIAGSALGFLPHNFNPARIFMGDAGAMFFGFMLAAVSVEGMLKSTATIAFLVPVLALGLPIFDTAFAIFRRLHNGVPFHQADRDHLHHRLLRLGLSHRDAVLVMYLVSGWLGISALALNGGGAIQAGMVLLFVGASIYLLARRSGLLEAEQRKNARH